MSLYSALNRSRYIINTKSLAQFKDILAISSRVQIHTLNYTKPCTVFYHKLHNVNLKTFNYSTEPKTDTIGQKEAAKEVKEQALTQVQKLKKAVADYGSTVIVFHIGISLVSLGLSYLLVSNGLDAAEVVKTLGFKEDGKTFTAVSSAGTFAVAYALHKVFAPVRITITLTSVPFVVRFLRQKGILKKP